MVKHLLCFLNFVIIYTKKARYAKRASVYSSCIFNNFNNNSA